MPRNKSLPWCIAIIDSFTEHQVSQLILSTLIIDMISS